MHSIQFIFAAVAATLSSYLAHKTGKNPWKWFGIGAVLGFFGILPIFFLSSIWQKQKNKSRTPAKTYFIDGPYDLLWYYSDNENQVGPMSHKALTQAWHEEKIGPSTYVWHEGLPEWKPLQGLIKVRDGV